LEIKIYCHGNAPRKKLLNLKIVYCIGKSISVRVIENGGSTKGLVPEITIAKRAVSCDDTLISFHPLYFAVVVVDGTAVDTGWEPYPGSGISKT
jgi:hypothetical protein